MSSEKAVIRDLKVDLRGRIKSIAAMLLTADKSKEGKDNEEFAHGFILLSKNTSNEY